MYGIALILFLSIMGGAIAFGGDRLGSKIGKKRLSILGLRPKHTSIVVTVITGALTVALTMSILTFVSRDVRTALFGMEQLKSELVSLSNEVEQKSAELTSSQDALAKQMAEYNKLDVQIRETTERLSYITNELATATAERDRAAEELAKVQGDYSVAQEQLTLLETTKQELDRRVDDLTQSKGTLETEVKELEAISNQLLAGLQNIREGAILFRNGEVLATAVIKHGLSKEEAVQTLQGAIQQINNNILARLNIKEQNIKVLWVSQDDYDKALDSILSSDDDVIVRVTAAGNSVYGEAVVGRIEHYSNKLVYPRGTLVYEQSFKAGERVNSEETVLVFLSKVNEAALKSGLLFDPLQGTVGVMSAAEVYAAVNQVNRADGDIVLRAYTREDIYTVGPLRIDIEVK
ncbi:MAG: DUF3084 domain-containing protein [Selenomonadales bacterium]|nr:DUF3084 domain-containing protein [Selenomonadales bacterium]MBQ6713657.1 DUF3084 domain-containing protein [Selenomonadales bacterium]